MQVHFHIKPRQRDRNGRWAVFAAHRLVSSTARFYGVTLPFFFGGITLAR